MEWITARLFQASTVKGLIQLGGSLGLWSLSPSMEGAVVALVMGLLGLINVYVDEHKASNRAAAKVATSVAESVANTAVEQNLPWLVKEVQNQTKE